MIKKNTKFLWLAAGILLLLFAVLIVLVKCVDVQAIGPENSEIGLAALNGAVHDAVGVHDSWYTVTDWIGKGSIALGLLFACLGVYQLIRRRSFARVDMDLYLLGATYVVLACLYLFFEFCIVNYRPVILDAGLEASFPSSHTMLTVCILGCALFQIRRRVPNRPLRSVLMVLSALVIAVMVVGRLLSGVHWFTDILGGVLLGTALTLVYIALVQTLQKEKT